VPEETGAASERTSYRISDDDAAVAREQERLAALAASRDPRTIRAFEAIGVGPGWECLEVGAGSGTVAAWLAGHVLPGGHVVSVDIDLRFHCEPMPGMEVRQLDVVHDDLPTGTFDLVHARALLQHLEQREAVLDRFVAATKPGGWVVIEESHWGAFETQPLPPALARVAEVMHANLRRREGWDPNVGGRMLRMFDERGLIELDVTGAVSTMRGGDKSGTWWFLGIEHVAENLVERGMLEPAELERALATVRSPDFVMMGPVSLTVRGRVRQP
jgi:SAM-dependent methyltransferase